MPAGATASYSIEDAVGVDESDGREIVPSESLTAGQDTFVAAPAWSGVALLWKFTSTADLTVTIVSH